VKIPVYINTLLIFLLCFGGNSLNASTIGSSSLNLTEKQPRHFGILSESYLSNANPGANAQTTTTHLDLHYKNEFSSSWSLTRIEGVGILAVSQPSQYSVDFHELSISSSPKLSSVGVTLGRHKESWSQMDDYWKLGVWQPRWKWDALNPEIEGLTGAFLTVKQPLFQFVAFGSPIFIPEQNPGLVWNNQNFESNTRWVQAPQQRVSVFDNPTSVVYDVKTPPTEEIVLKPSTGAFMRLGGSQGFWGQLGYAYKPVNQLLVGYTGKMLLDNSNPRVGVTIYPRVVYHQLISSETGYQTDRWNFWGSVMHETPYRDKTPDDWTTQELNPALNLSTAASVKPFRHMRGNPKLGVGYFRSIQRLAPDQGPLAKGNVSLFEPRYMFQNAISANLDTDWSELQYLTDLRNRGSLISASVLFHPAEYWTLNFGLDFLGVDGEGDSQGFIGRYRTNDRVRGGLTYVF
jgi:hypothetical protein